MKKLKILEIILIIFVLILIFGVGINSFGNNNSLQYEESSNFEVIGMEDIANYKAITVFQKQTKVMYIITYCQGYPSKHNITMLVDEDGKPLIYKE